MSRSGHQKRQRPYRSTDRAAKRRQRSEIERATREETDGWWRTVLRRAGDKADQPSDELRVEYR